MSQYFGFFADQLFYFRRKELAHFGKKKKSGLRKKLIHPGKDKQNQKAG